MSTGPDGALYLPQAPLRRAFSVALGLTTDPLVGGVSKWSSTRNDLLARDAACAAADRAGNALVEQLECPASATADMAQVDVLRLQMAGAAERAVADGDLDVGLGRRILRLSAKLGQPPGNQSEASTRYLREASRYPQRAARLLEQACRLLSSAGGENRARSGQQLRNGRDR
jgi:hypothetical protein